MRFKSTRKPPRPIWWFIAFLLLLMSSHLPLIGELISVTVLVPPGLAVYMLLRGIARFDTKFVIYFLFMTIVACLSFIINRDNPYVSLTSLIYLLYLLTPFMLRFTVPNRWRVRTAKSFWLGYRYFMLFTTILGLIQLLMMDLFVSFRDILPETFRVGGYNTTNAIIYGGSIFRANGFFFYEPSFFSQFLGIAILVEIQTRRNLFILGLYVAGILASFSGTGLILLGLGMLLIAKNSLSFSKKDAFIAFSPLFVIAFIGIYIFPDYFISRLEEFVTENSSASIRFVSPLIYVYSAFSSSFLSMLFGIGPGLSSSVRTAEVMADFPGIGKILFEYGLLGMYLIFAIYFGFCARAKMASWIQWPILLIQFVLNNGVFTPITLAFFILITLFGTTQCFSVPSRHARRRRTIQNDTLQNSEEVNLRLPSPKLNEV